MENRHINYNQQTAYIENMQKSGKAFVIRPKKAGNVGRIEKDVKKLKALYREGYEDAAACYEELMKYLKEE